MLKNIFKSLFLVVALIFIQPTQAKAIGDRELGAIFGIGAVAILGTIMNDTPSYNHSTVIYREPTIVYREPTVIYREPIYERHYPTREVTVIRNYPSYHRNYNDRHDNKRYYEERYYRDAKVRGY